MNDLFDIGMLLRRRVRLVRQAEVADCGLASLAMVASYHGLDVDMSALRRSFTASSRGMSLRSMIAVADDLGFMTRAVKVPLDGLSGLSLPAVLHWNMNHFVVLERVTGQRALIHDPTGRSGWLRFQEIAESFTGVALEVVPGSNFEPADLRQRLRLRNLWSGLRGLRRASAQTIVLSLVLQFFIIAAPYYGQLAIDIALPEADVSLLTTLGLVFALLAVLSGVTSLLRASVLLTVGSTFGFGLTSNVVRRLFRLPIDWFARRQVGDILSRFQSVMPIRQMLAEDAPASLVDGVFAVITLVLMSLYSLVLTLVAIITLTIYLLFRWAFFRAQRLSQEAAMVAAGKEQSILIESLQGMRALRLSGHETSRHAVWQAQMHEAINSNIANQRIANWQSVLHTTIFALENIVTLWFSIRFVMKGTFTLGMLFAFIAYKGQFLIAGAALVEKVTSLRMLGLHLERLSEIVLSEEDVAFREDFRSTDALLGRLELRGVRYRYGISDPEVLKGISLKVEPGEAVAITGPSGGGKTTLIHILLGLIRPSSGEVLIDGIPLERFGHRNFFRQVAAVLQDDNLFAGSIADNIAMFDTEPELERVMAAATAAAIHDEITAMPMKYNTLVGGMTTSLSGGQKQRILLARALYRNPKILVMDEATSHLDEDRERAVNREISSLGITKIIVAHRKETIASADRVFLLVNGILEQSSAA